MTIIALVGIGALVVGIVLFLRGLRGVPVLTHPTCAKCKYDLRGMDPERSDRCPECGADLKARRAVLFGKHERRPRLMLLGAILALVPLILIGLPILQAMLGIRWSDFKSNSSVIASLPQTADRSQDWKELERRYSAGKLSSEEVAQAIDHLIAHLNAKPKRADVALHSAWGFLGQADSDGLIADEQLARLCDAYYGAAPVVTTRRRIQQGQPLGFEITYGGHMALLNMILLTALGQVTLSDGRELALVDDRMDRLSAHGPSRLRGKVALDIEPGQYEVIFDVDLALVSWDDRFRIARGEPGPARRWPKARRKWARKIAVPLTVVPAGASTVTLIDDPAGDPAANEQIRVELLRLSRDRRGRGIDIRFACSESVAMCFDVIVQMGEQTLTAGTFRKPGGRTGSLITGNSYGADVESDLDEIPSHLTTATVVLRPNAAAAAETIGMDSIWGKEIVFKDVPVHRFDLDELEE